MTPNEADKIIAEYMGLTVYSKEPEFIPSCTTQIREDFLKYSVSIDSLLPVWEKLKPHYRQVEIFISDKTKGVSFYFNNSGGATINEYKGYKNNFHQCAAIATARVISKIRIEEDLKAKKK